MIVQNRENNTSKSVESTPISENTTQEWIHIKHDDYANTIADAFRDGKQKGERAFFELKFKELSKNVTAAKDKCESFFYTLRKNKIKCTSVHLKPIDVNLFEAVFVIPAKDFFSDKYGEALKLSKNFHDEQKKIDIIYKFIPYSKKINDDAFVADGFVYYYR